MPKYEGWKQVATPQFKEIIAELVEAKEESRSLMLIANTGLGKSNAIKQFQAKKPKNTFVITIGDSHNLRAIIEEIMNQLGLEMRTGHSAKHSNLTDISYRLNEIAADNGFPVIIFDEAENAKISTLKAIKEIYDAVSDHCGIVLIGTDQLIDQLNRKSKGQSIPQLRRRFKAGTRYIALFNKAKDMKPFFDLYIPAQEDLKDLLIQLCDNYGELHDYLDVFLRYCDKNNKPVTVDNFRLFHKIPKH